MKILCSFFAFSWVFMTYAQTELRKQSIDSGGALTQSGTITMLFTVGEVVVAEGVSSTYSISEGFIGKDMNISLNLDEFDELIGVSIYPNPFVSELNITFPNSSQYDIELYQRIEELLGKKLPLYPTDKNAAMALHDKVGEAQRTAIMQMKELAASKKNGSNKRFSDGKAKKFKTDKDID